MESTAMVGINRFPRVRGAFPPSVSAVYVGVLAAAVASGFVLNDATFSDADGFARSAQTLLSTHWRETYADPWLQAGPLEQLICYVGSRFGGSGAWEPSLLNAMGALALLLTAHRVVGAHARQLLFVGVGALLLGVVTDMYAIGHPSELFIALVWIFVARACRRGATAEAGFLLGLSAGFETWGLLGAPLLFLLPRVRRSITAGAIAIAVAAAIYAPFAIGNSDFRMFSLRWHVAGGLDSYVLGEGTRFSWPMRLTEALIVVGLGTLIALALRHRSTASWWIVPTFTSFLRLFLDPVRYPYYWDTGLTLVLIGTAPWFTAPIALAGRCSAFLSRRTASMSARRNVPIPE